MKKCFTQDLKPRIKVVAQGHIRACVTGTEAESDENEEEDRRIARQTLLEHSMKEAKVDFWSCRRWDISGILNFCPFNVLGNVELK